MIRIINYIMGNKTAKDEHYEDRTILFIVDLLYGNY